MPLRTSPLGTKILTTRRTLTHLVAPRMTTLSSCLGRIAVLLVDRPRRTTKAANNRASSALEYLEVVRVESVETNIGSDDPPALKRSVALFRNPRRCVESRLLFVPLLPALSLPHPPLLYSFDDWTDFSLLKSD